jgi:hypothetical protein
MGVPFGFYAARTWKRGTRPVIIATSSLRLISGANTREYALRMEWLFEIRGAQLRTSLGRFSSEMEGPRALPLELFRFKSMASMHPFVPSPFIGQISPSTRTSLERARTIDSCPTAGHRCVDRVKRIKSLYCSLNLTTTVAI